VDCCRGSGDLPWQNKCGMTLESLRQASRETILATAARYGAHNVRVFGSLARGEADDMSDLDLLVDMDHDRSLMDMGDLLMERQLNLQIDVATERMLRQDIRRRVLSEAVPL
jgi:predicted nucleotidyltransferase